MSRQQHTMISMDDLLFVAERKCDEMSVCSYITSTLAVHHKDTSSPSDAPHAVNDSGYSSELRVGVRTLDSPDNLSSCPTLDLDVTAEMCSTDDSVSWYPTADHIDAEDVSTKIVATVSMSTENQLIIGQESTPVVELVDFVTQLSHFPTIFPMMLSYVAEPDLCRQVFNANEVTSLLYYLHAQLIMLFSQFSVLID